jgi:hypothetical protein
MKQLRIFYFISCFVIVLYFLIFSFSDISIAEQTSEKNCISDCAKKQQACFNINADKRQCEVKFQNCAAACKSEEESPSTTQKGSNSTVKPMKPM